jgi:TonB family protein
MKKYALSLTSAFTTPSMLKARIVMLYRKPSARIALAKFGFVLPVLCMCLALSAFAQKKDKFRFPEIPDEYKHYKSFLIEAGKKDTLTLSVKKGHFYAFLIVPMEDKFAPNDKIHYGTVDEKSTFFGGVFLNQLRSGKRSPLEVGRCYKTEDAKLYFYNHECSSNVYFYVYEADYTKINEQTIHTRVDMFAQHPIIQETETYINNKLRFPEKAKKAQVKGTVEIECIVNVDGSLSDIKISKSLGYGCDEEALRLVKETAGWQSGKIQNRDENGRFKFDDVRQRITIKIPFQL